MQGGFCETSEGWLALNSMDVRDAQFYFKNLVIRITRFLALM